MKISDDIIGNRTRDFPVCSAVPQPAAPSRAPVKECRRIENMMIEKLPPEALHSVCMHLAT